MTRLTRYLLTALLLLPSVAVAQFNPAAHPDIIYYVPSIADEPTKYFIGNNSDGGAATTAGDLVGTIQTGVSGVNFVASTIAPGTERRLPLAADALGVLGIQGTSARQLRHNVASYANAIHQARKLWFIAVFQPNASLADTRAFLDNTNLALSSATSAQGLTAGTQSFANGTSIGGIFRKTSGAVPRLRIKNATGTPIIEIHAEDDLADATPSRHVIIGFIDPDDECWLQVDRGRKSYARVTGDAGTGNAAFGMALMSRPSADLHMPGILLSLGLYSQYPGDDELADWLERWPLGDIAGSPEIRVAGTHMNFSKDQAGMPYSIWWNKKRISGISSAGNEEGGNVVLNDGVGTDYLGGSTGNSGGPHRNEVLNSATVSIDGAAPVAMQNGNIYEGASRVQVVRNTTIGISFEQIETATIDRNSLRVHTVLTRLGDSRTINPLYFRESRATTYEDFLAFDAAGEIAHDDSVTTTDFQMDAGVIAIAQWSPTGVMALTVITKGQELNLTNTIFYSADSSRRIYHKLNTIPTGTQSVEFATISKFYETTEEDWKDLAESELLKVLNGAGSGSGNKRIGLGIGIGLGSVERKSPAQKLAAAFNHEYTLAP